MLTDWYLIDLRTNGIKYESAAAGAEKISGVHINKLGAYLYRKLTDKGKQPEKLSDPEKKCQSIWFEIYSWAHKWCKTINAECSNCKKIGHFSEVCQKKEIHNVEINVNNIGEEETEIYQLNICNVENYSKYTEIFNYP